MLASRPATPPDVPPARRPRDVVPRVPSRPPTRPVRVLLDVPALVRAGLGALLGPLDDRVEPVDPDATGRADVVVFDPDDHRGRGPATAPEVPRVALSRDLSPRAAARARELGAVAVLPLSVGVGDFVRTLERVRDHPRRQHRQTRSVGPLSPREADVVAGICRGLSNAEIAAELYLSVNSVKTYVRTAYRKMGVESRSQAVLWGFHHGL